MIARLVVSTVVGGIVLTALGFLLYGLLLSGYMQANTNQYVGMNKIPPNWVMLIGAHFVFALLLSVVAECWAKARNFPSGLKIGLIVAFLVAAWADSMFESMFDIFKGAAPMVVDVIVGTALGGITGGVIGLILGKMDKGESNG